MTAGRAQAPYKSVSKGAIAQSAGAPGRGGAGRVACGLPARYGRTAASGRRPRSPTRIVTGMPRISKGEAV